MAGEPPYMRVFSAQQLVTEIPECLRARRCLLKSKLKEDEMLLSISQFPLLGDTTNIYIDGQGSMNGPLLRSQLLSDDCLHQIPPFALEIDGIIERRGAVPYTAVPVFHDADTPWPFVDPGLSPAALDFGILRLPDARTGSGSGSGGNRDRDSGCAMGAHGKIGSNNSGPANTVAMNGGPPITNLAQGRIIDAFQSGPVPASSPLLEIPSNRNSLLLDSPLFGVGSGGILR
ncbi:glutamate--cysteine ligase, partial [Coemansia aciculifera]